MADNKTTFVITVFKERCKGCGYCKETCPKDVFEFEGELNAAGYSVSCAKHLDRCIGCNSCVMVCPDMALELGEAS